MNNAVYSLCLEIFGESTLYFNIYSGVASKTIGRNVRNQYVMYRAELKAAR